MLKIALIEGGYSHEKEVSLRSATTVAAHLDPSKYDVTRVRIDEEGWFVYENNNPVAEIDRNDFSAKVNGEKINFDFAFILIHGTPGEDGKLQAYFDMLSIPYNTSNQLLSTLTFNKFVCNRFLSNFGIDVAKAVLISKGEEINSSHIISEVGLPCFVKPADGGSSFGVSKVKTIQELEPAIHKAIQHGTQALIESFLNGREFTNGVYLGRNGIKVLPITEIITKNEFFDFEAKYQGASEEITPAQLNAEITEKIKSITFNVFKLLNMSGIARIDYIVMDNIPYLIEINTVPGQSAQSIIPQMAKAEGIPLGQIFDEVIELSIRK
jgi:D-alanine-D-alanine ligase